MRCNNMVLMGFLDNFIRLTVAFHGSNIEIAKQQLSQLVCLVRLGAFQLEDREFFF